MKHKLGSHHLDAGVIYKIITTGQKISLDPQQLEKVRANRDYLEQKLQTGTNAPIYGINTGFGSLCNVSISDEDLDKLQENLILSHACGMGQALPENLCRTILLLKIINLLHGNSGVRVELVEKLSEFYDKGVIPVIYEQGSLGASGDLVPLAHLSLPLLGKGLVYHHGTVKPAAEAMSSEGIASVKLKFKEGLALINGTQFSLAFATIIVQEAMAAFRLANRIAALSMDAYLCDLAPFDPLIHDIRPHPGQSLAAKEILGYLTGSSLRPPEKKSVQDPYSFRCVPQVHGASFAAFSHAEEIVNTEINSVTDNPNVFDTEDKILSGGNFHAQPLALILDYMAIALAELGNISERRVYQLINGDRRLPPYLAVNAGLDSGFMIVQYTAASIVSQNKQYCTPASVDSIVSSKGQEDHVSMAANAATKCYRVLTNVKSLLAIELLTATQALEFRRPAVSSPPLEQLFARVRSEVPFLQSDRLMHDDMLKITNMIDQWVQSGGY